MPASVVLTVTLTLRILNARAYSVKPHLILISSIKRPMCSPGHLTMFHFWQKMLTRCHYVFLRYRRLILHLQKSAIQAALGTEEILSMVTSECTQVLTFPALLENLFMLQAMVRLLR